MDNEDLIYGNLELLKSKLIDICGDKIGNKYYKKILEQRDVNPPKIRTLKFFILKYNSLELGIKRYYEKNISCSPSMPLKDLWVEKYGEEEGVLMWGEYISNLRKKLKGKNTLSYYIEKYGEEDGPIEYKKYCEKISKTSKGRNNKESFIEKYGEKEGIKKHREFWVKRSTRDQKFFVSKYGEKEGKKRYKNYIKKITLTKERFIEKYGEEDGVRRYNLKTERWINSMKLLSDDEKERINRAKCYKRSYSKVSQELFWELFFNIRNKYSDIYFATFNQETKSLDDSGTNNEYMVFLNEINHAFLDFYVKDVNKCIEFDGTYWHENSKEKDFERERKIKEVLGCDVLRVSQEEYITSKEYVIKKCMEFLNVW